MFVLDPRLRRDTLPVGAFALSELLLMNDARYPWCILVPRVEDVSEVFELSAAQQSQWWEETSLVAQRMQQHFHADKLNVATLGNQVRQLHMHVIARRHGDDAWPAPVWGKFPPIVYAAGQADIRLAELRHMLRDRLVV